MSKFLATIALTLLCFCSMQNLNGSIFTLLQSLSPSGFFPYDENGGDQTGDVDVGSLVNGNVVKIVFDYNDSDGEFTESNTMLDFTNFQLFANGSSTPISLSIMDVEPGLPGQYLQLPGDGGEVKDAFVWISSTSQLTLLQRAVNSQFDNNFDNDPNNPHVQVSSRIVVTLMAAQSLNNLSIDKLTFEGTWDMGASFANDFISVSGEATGGGSCVCTDVTLDSANPFTRIRDVGGLPTDFYEISPDNDFLNIHTQDSRLDTNVTAPFRFAVDAAPGLFTIGNGGVAIGAHTGSGITTIPLHVLSLGPGVDNSVDHAKIVVEDQDTKPGSRTLIELINAGGARCAFTNSVTGGTWAFQTNNSDGFLFNFLGSGGNEMSIRPTGIVTMGPGGVQNFLLDSVGNLTILGTLNQASDRNVKEDFADVDEQKILEKISQLPVTSWKYKRDTDPIRHIGPAAQDFHAAFGMGESEKTISVTDASGVALVGIKALNARCEHLQKQVNEKDNQIAGQNGRIADLETQVVELAARLSQLESNSPR